MKKKINNKQQYYSAMAEIENYLQKGISNLTETEENHLDELSRAVEIWELKEYPMPMQPSFQEILIYIMQYKRYSQAKLSEDLSISKSLLSEILSGKKQPNLDLVINLHQGFGIDANILLESISPATNAGKKSA
ncbi:MAG: helix-turn-helix domain-containing protein [Bacteroidota bacterium]|nr:helix-turn-helix domain-containing protein [Bacteroidota bacterium]